MVQVGRRCQGIQNSSWCTPTTPYPFQYALCFMIYLYWAHCYIFMLIYVLWNNTFSKSKWKYIEQVGAKTGEFFYWQNILECSEYLQISFHREISGIYPSVSGDIYNLFGRLDTKLQECLRNKFGIKSKRRKASKGPLPFVISTIKSWVGFYHEGH